MFRWAQGFNADVLEFFKSQIVKLSEDDVGFVYADRYGQRLDVEKFGPAKWYIPPTDGIWQVCRVGTVEVRNLYIFSSAINALAFFHFYTSNIIEDRAIAIVSIGLVPKKDKALYLLSKYPNAKIHLVFGSGILDRVGDCLFVCWLKRKNYRFRVCPEGVEAWGEMKSYIITLDSFSLSLFEKLTGIRSRVRTHKPGKDYESFIHQLNIFKSSNYE